MSCNRVNAQYHDEKTGEKYASEELLPVVRKFSAGFVYPKILEVGCGFGRNLSVLAQLPDAKIFGCDIDAGELEKSKVRLRMQGKHLVKLVLQEDPSRLPFKDNEFDMIILWQVLEHVLCNDLKRNLLLECRRVVKSGGVIIIETPNWFFPLDHHDTGLPLAHYLPNFIRQFLLKKIRHADWSPSQYLGIFNIDKILNETGAKAKRQTKIYFADKYWDIFKNIGGSRVKLKKLIFVLYYPLYLFLVALGWPGDLLAPSLRLVYRISK